MPLRQRPSSQRRKSLALWNHRLAARGPDARQIGANGEAPLKKQRLETGDPKALPPLSLIDRMRQQLPTMKRADKAVADALLENIDAATRSSVKALAGRAGVSEPSVIRFARHMGCDGFSDFKIRLAQDYAIGRMYLSADYQHPANTGSDVAGHVYEATSQALASAFAQRDPEALERAADLIDGSRRIFCFGVGGSSANVAAEAENRLFRLDLAASATADAYKQRITAATAGKNDVFLMFSVTGRPRSLIESARSAKQCGASIIAVTAGGTPLAMEADVLIPLVAFDEEKFFYMPNRGRYGQLFILDCLATLLGGRRMKHISSKLWNARTMLADLNGESENQPVGD